MMPNEAHHDIEQLKQHLCDVEAQLKEEIAKRQALEIALQQKHDSEKLSTSTHQKVILRGQKSRAPTAELRQTNFTLQQQVKERQQIEARLQQQNRQLSSLYMAGQMITGPLQLSKVLDIIVRSAAGLLETEVCTILLLDKKANILRLREVYGIEKSIINEVYQHLQEAFVTQIIQTNIPVIVNNLEHDPIFQQTKAFQNGLLAFASVPLMIGGKFLGTLDVYSKTNPSAFYEQDLQILSMLTHQAAVTIANVRLYNQEKKQRQIAESLREVAITLTRTLDRDTVLSKILIELKRVIHYDGAGIFLHSDGALVLSGGSFYSKAYLGKRILLTSNDPTARSFKEKKPLILADVLADPDWKIWLEGDNIRAWMGVPLQVDHQPIGVLTIDNLSVNAYTEADAQILQIFANQAAVAIENARLFEATQTALDQTQTLYAASLALSSTMDLEQVFQLILTQLQLVVPYDSASVQELQDDELEVIWGHGFPDLEQVIGLQFKLDETINPNGLVLKMHKPLIINDVQGRYSNFETTPHIRSWIGVPLLFRDVVLGMITIDKHEPDFYTDNHANLAMAFATQAAIAIANARLYNQAQIALISEEEANQAKSRFLASMSHEFRTPLNAISGYVQILQTDETISPKQWDMLSVIKRSSEHLLTLINDILDISKIEAGKMELNMVSFYLDGFLQNVMSILQLRAEQKGLTLLTQPYDFSRNEPVVALPHWIFCDEKRLRQVLINLLGNAIKFTDKGSITLKVGYVHGENYQQEPEYVMNIFTSTTIRFLVEDTGIGIPAEQLKTIFQPFEQVKGPTRRKSEGTGLGLAISHRLVEMMGGELKVKSEVKRGSKFWFDLDLPVRLGAGLDDAQYLLPEEAQIITTTTNALTSTYHKVSANANQTTIVPSSEQLMRLADLAMIGDVAGIEEFAIQMEHNNANLKSFTTELQRLAKEFQIKKIRRLLDMYM